MECRRIIKLKESKEEDSLDDKWSAGGLSS
jgi:hypothetical protein